LAVNVDERPRPQENAEAYTRRIAGEKARTALRARPHAWILAADTVVEIDGLILGKPPDAAAARSMLSRLAGRTHRVLTAVTLVTAEGGVHVEEVVESRVRFRPLSVRDIDAYVATGEPFDKAGSYAVQGLGGRLVERVEGSYSSVVGLPLELVREALATRGLLP
jgi:septum formation protein